MQNVPSDVVLPFMAYDAVMGLLDVCRYGLSGGVDGADHLSRVEKARSTVEGVFASFGGTGGDELRRLGRHCGCRGAVGLGVSDVDEGDDLGDRSASCSRPGGGGGTGPDVASGVRFGVWDGVKRGPNYARNKVWREKKKKKRENKKRLGSETQEVGTDVPEWRRGAGFFSECDSETKEQLRETRAKLLIARNQRQLVQESLRLRRLESPMQVVNEVMALERRAKECAQVAHDSKVAGWAATVYSSESESVARSAPGSIQSFGSVSSAKELVDRKSRFGLDVLPPTAIEQAALRARILGEAKLLALRIKYKRCLEYADLTSGELKVSVTQLRALDDIHNVNFFEYA